MMKGFWTTPNLTRGFASVDYYEDDDGVLDEEANEGIFSWSDDNDDEYLDEDELKVTNEVIGDYTYY